MQQNSDIVRMVRGGRDSIARQSVKIGQ